MFQRLLKTSFWGVCAALAVACTAPKPVPVATGPDHAAVVVKAPSGVAEVDAVPDHAELEVMAPYGAPEVGKPPAAVPEVGKLANHADPEVETPSDAPEVDAPSEKAEVGKLPKHADPEVKVAATPAPPRPAAAFPDHADPKVNAPFVASNLNVKLWTERFEGESREVYRAKEALIAALELKAGMRVADIGAGTGLFVKYLADAVGASGAVFAVDIAEPFLAQIRARVAKAGLTQVTTVRGAATKTNLAAASIDLAWICDVYHHFEDPALMLADIHTALRPGGRLAVVDFHRIPGVTSAFILGHVRADKATFVAEIEAAGFRLLPERDTPFLTENYLVIFERITP